MCSHWYQISGFSTIGFSAIKVEKEKGIELVICSFSCNKE
jgi:hypothetical protein